MRLRILATILAALACSCGARAQAQNPAETKNAAILYCAAFAEMQYPPSELIENLPDETAWNETKFAPTLDANAQAIRTMQRATNLPECDWGPEGEGPKASSVYLLQARALTRLNALEGIRQMVKGDSQAAVNTWLAGIHFSQDVTRGKPVINVLVAKQLLLPNLRVLIEESRQGRLKEGQKKQVYAAVKGLPEDGLDWRGSWGAELARGEKILLELQTAADPRAMYKALAGVPAPKKGVPPTAQEIQAYCDYMAAVQIALREPPADAKILLDGLEAKRLSLGDVEQALIPNPQSLNAARTEVITARAELLQSLVSK